MEQQFRFGIIGYGLISEYHAQAIKAQTNAKIFVASDIVKESADKFAAKYNCEVIDDWQKMINREDIDAVCVCTPTGFHAEQSNAAAKAGKHVLVEKTMATNLADATEMIHVASDNGVKLGVIYQKRTEEALNKIKKAIADGVFGKLVFDL
jgi:UDP-N-acetyl-2-amino-2-deoxyglucuronate dehydrogenase